MHRSIGREPAALQRRARGLERPALEQRGSVAGAAAHLERVQQVAVHGIVHQHAVADRRDELRAVRLEADVVDDALDAVAVWDAVGPGRHAAHGGGSAGRAPPPRPVRARAVLAATLQ
jgi:hypothetical protein